MPWSEWRQSPDVTSAVWGRFRTGAYITRTPPGDPPVPGEGEPFYTVERFVDFPYEPNVLEATWTAYPGDEPPRTHIQFLLGDDAADPSVLWLPTLPGDYFTVLPDVWPPPDIEWEAERGSHLGWEWDGAPQITDRSGAPLSGTLEVISPSSYFTTWTPPETRLDDHPDYPLPAGPAAASFGGSDPVGTDLAALPDPEAVFGFAVTIDPVLSTVAAAITITLPRLFARVRFPRWRYWIPGPAGSNVRQVHRDDGLGVTPKRARGASSRNATNRALAYD